jgi:hypothetical protein
MSYDPRYQGHPGQQPQPSPPRQLTFGSVFWACFLALMAWSAIAWVIVEAVNEQSSGF